MSYILSCVNEVVIMVILIVIISTQNFEQCDWPIQSSYFLVFEKRTQIIEN